MNYVELIIANEKRALKKVIEERGEMLIDKVKLEKQLAWDDDKWINYLIEHLNITTVEELEVKAKEFIEAHPEIAT